MDRLAGLRGVVVVALVALVLALPAQAQIQIPATYSSVLTFAGHNLNLLATVTQNPSGSFHYNYVVTFTTSWSGRNLGSFSVGNQSFSPYSNAGNNQPNYYSNPVDSAGGDPLNNSVFWNLRSSTNPFPYSAGGSVQFWFDSPYPCVYVQARTGGGWGPAAAQTLGIGTPEPASIAGLAAGLAWLGAVVRRRRR